MVASARCQQTLLLSRGHPNNQSAVRRNTTLTFTTRSALALVALLLLPTAAFAQAAIAGAVRDSSGAVLPGVTVEAASPVLIERVRSVVSDDTGQYRIVDLRPGTFTVTFTLAGFSALK